MKIRKHGFTLIELLVVIAIIALLLSIVVPGLRKAKDAARSITCISNLRQMSVGFSTYSVEHDGKLFAFAYGENYWFRHIAPYLGDAYFQKNPDMNGSGVMQIGICPATKIQTAKENGTYNTTWHFSSMSSENIVGSYGINAWVLQDPDAMYKKWGGNTVDANLRLFDRYAHVRQDVGILSDAYRFDNWPAQVQGCRVPNAAELKEPGGLPHNLQSFMLRYTMHRHGTTVNVAYAGCSVEKVKVEELYLIKWNKNDGPMQVQVASK